jgi:hypothetical protein
MKEMSTMKRTIAALVAGLVLGGTATGLAASRALTTDVYPGAHLFSFQGLDLACGYERANAANPRGLICFRESLDGRRGVGVLVSARTVRVVNFGTRAVLYQHSRNP